MLDGRDELTLAFNVQLGALIVLIFLFFDVRFLLSHFLFYFVTLHLLILLIILLPVLTRL